VQFLLWNNLLPLWHRCKEIADYKILKEASDAQLTVYLIDTVASSKGRASV